MTSSRAPVPRLGPFLQRVREPAFWLSPELKLIWVNHAWEALTGHAAGSAVGLTCRAHGPSGVGGVSDLCGSLYPPPEAVGGRPAVSRTLFVHPDGERLWRRVEYWPFHHESGGLFGLLGLVHRPDDPPLAADAGSMDLRTHLLELRDGLRRRHGLDTLIGTGPAHRRLLEQVSAAATCGGPVVVVGEPGTGRRLLARTIHQLGPRPDAPLVPIDCAALPADVLDRELFGPPGDAGGLPVLHRLNLPEGSTLVLGDIVDLPRDLQGRLAASLDGRVRLVAYTSTDPDAALKVERLRSDLYYRLTTLVVRVTPLRDRPNDLPLLSQHLLERANLRGGVQRTGFSAEAMQTLLAYDWPGNVRELARALDDAHSLSRSDLIQAEDLPAAIRGNLGAAFTPDPVDQTTTPLDELLTVVERRLIENCLVRAKQNKSRAAEMLGISRPRLYRRIKELNLPDPPEPAEDPVRQPHPAD